MILTTDTIGNSDSPTKSDIQSAISYPGEKAREGDIVKLMIDDTHYLVVWIGQIDPGHRVVFSYGSTKVTCAERLNTKTAIELMIKYLQGDISWVKEYQWDQPIEQQFLENLEILRTNQ